MLLHHLAELNDTLPTSITLVREQISDNDYMYEVYTNKEYYTYRFSSTSNTRCEGSFFIESSHWRSHVYSFNKPYNFIWSDISQLWFKLPTKYDFIHLSNICDYCPPEKRKNVLLSLMSHVNVGGTILMHDQILRGTNQACQEIVVENPTWKYVNHGCSINTLIRTR